MVNHDLVYCRMKNTVFWDVVLCRSCMNRRFGGTYRLHLQGRKICKRGTSMSRWQQTEPPVRNTQLYKNRGEGGRESRPHGKSVERSGRVCRDQVGRPGGQVAEEVGKRQGYRASIDLHSLVDLASCSGGFLRVQMRGFHDLLRLLQG
jgi:hypothetical protein